MAFIFTKRALPYCAAISGAIGGVYAFKKFSNSDSLSLSKTVVRTASLAPEGTCPVKHDVKPVCPVKHDAIPSQTEAPAAVCPVKHTVPTTTEGVCPVKHDGEQSGGFLSVLPKPKQPSGQASHGYGLFADKLIDGPAEGDDRYVDPNQEDPYVSSESLVNIPYPDEIPGGRIPATGRGNSVDGSDWVNPTPSELFRALRRKQKYIEEHDAYAVAFVHSVVVDSTWDQILTYEDMHKDECETPTLNRFEGKYGDLTFKTHLNNMLGWFDRTGELIPFDRHDWYVNRCGKEVRYIIDYYATEDAEGNNTYFCDCRPEPSVSGLTDRVKMTWKKIRAGESLREIW